MDAVRWGASADVRAFQVSFRSGVTTEDYQLDPVFRAIQMPWANLLSADEVCWTLVPIWPLPSNLAESWPPGYHLVCYDRQGNVSMH
jgi:hypothetical protein